MRKKNIFVLIVICILFCGCSGNISQEDYDKLANENKELKDELNNLKNNDWYDIGKEQLITISESTKEKICTDYSNAITYIQNNISSEEQQKYISYIDELYSNSVDSIYYAVNDYIISGEKLAETMDESKLTQNNLDTLLYSRSLISTADASFTIRVRELLPNYDESYNGFE